MRKLRYNNKNTTYTALPWICQIYTYKQALLINSHVCWDNDVSFRLCAVRICQADLFVFWYFVETRTTRQTKHNKTKLMNWFVCNKMFDVYCVLLCTVGLISRMIKRHTSCFWWHWPHRITECSFCTLSIWIELTQENKNMSNNRHRDRHTMIIIIIINDFV